MFDDGCARKAETPLERISPQIMRLLNAGTLVPKADFSNG
jgi:hypothetical protein